MMVSKLLTNDNCRSVILGEMGMEMSDEEIAKRIMQVPEIFGWAYRWDVPKGEVGDLNSESFKQFIKDNRYELVATLKKRQ